MSATDAFFTIRPDDPGKVVLSVKGSHFFTLLSLNTLVPAPQRRPVAAIPGARRPTVAVLDTGVADHGWFVSDSPDDPIRLDAPALDGLDHPVTDPVFTWHGTFVAGLVRQTAPDARILPVQLAREGDDGGIANGSIHSGLKWLQEHVESHSGADFVDVICLAIGYRKEHEPGYTERVKKVIHELGRRGVLVVTAAGNHDASARPDAVEPAGIDDRGTEQWAVFPAALAKQDHPSDGLPIVAVGANKVDGTPAPYSPEADWVKYRLVGDGVTSTTPPGWSPPTVSSAPDREEIHADPTGFGLGSGTSFAAARFAGWLAQAMLDDVDPQGGAGVADTGPDAALRRSRRALAKADATNLSAV